MVTAAMKLRRSLLGRKAMKNLDSIDISLLINVHIVKVVVFSRVMYGSESRTKKKVKRQRIDAFEQWWWRRLLESLGLEGDQTSPF